VKARLQIGIQPAPNDAGLGVPFCKPQDHKKILFGTKSAHSETTTTMPIPQATQLHAPTLRKMIMLRKALRNAISALEKYQSLAEEKSVSYRRRTPSQRRSSGRQFIS
jgi:hypothetical protein